VSDRVLGDLTDDGLARLQDLLDSSIRGPTFNIFGIELQIAAIQHGVLGCRDIYESGFHTRKNVLYLAEINVAVNLSDVVGRTRHVVLNEIAAFKHRNLRRFGTHADRHHVAADRPSVSLTTLALFESLIVEFGAIAAKDRFDRPRSSGLLLLLTLLLA
jgi:hypothetical protein